jgi:hypothetical protein
VTAPIIRGPGDEPDIELCVYGKSRLINRTYPFGTVQLVYCNKFRVTEPISSDSYEWLLGAFDNTAAMIGMTSDRKFVFGSRFNITEVVCYCPDESRLLGGDQKLALRRFQDRMQKYADRGFAPAKIEPASHAQTVWQELYS